MIKQYNFFLNIKLTPSTIYISAPGFEIYSMARHHLSPISAHESSWAVTCMYHKSYSTNFQPGALHTCLKQCRPLIHEDYSQIKGPNKLRQVHNIIWSIPTFPFTVCGTEFYFPASLLQNVIKGRWVHYISCHAWVLSKNRITRVYCIQSVT